VIYYPVVSYSPTIGSIRVGAARRLTHRPNLLNRFAQLSPRKAKLLAPIAQLAVLIDVDTLVILPAGVLQIVSARAIRKNSAYGLGGKGRRLPS